jgi:hypothetical protein
LIFLRDAPERAGRWLDPVTDQPCRIRGVAGRLPPWSPGAHSFSLPGIFLRVVEEVAPQCSAKGCRASASWQLRWNNPKLHTPEHRKTWLACDEHRESLGGFLDVRGFLREVQPFPAATDAPTA